MLHGLELMEIPVTSLKVADFQSLATRESGAQALALVIGLLDQNKQVDLDLDKVSMTPSFADEFVGKLAAQLGAIEFRTRLVLRNASPAMKLLIVQVVSKRLADKNHAVA